MSFTYNGYQFSPQANYNATIAAQYDDRGITVIGQTMTLSVVDYIFPKCTGGDLPPTGNDVEVDLIYSKLMTAQGQLDIPDNIGLGTTNDDVALSNYYINGGPFPQSCEIKNLGGGMVTEIRWQVKFTFLPCWQADAGAFGIKAFNYSKQYTVDEKGFTSVVTSGYLERVPELSFAAGEKTSKETGMVDTNFFRNFVVEKFPELDNFHRNCDW